MNIRLHQAGKRYRYEWIFKGVDYTFEQGRAYAITGPNGCGKSTLMKMLSGHLTPSKGRVEFFQGDKRTEIDEVYRQVSFAAPYIEHIEEFTLIEAIQFHLHFKRFQKELTAEDIIQLLGFSKSKDKQIRNFSSGMKQRLKLALAICSDSTLLLLDEPTTNLDRQGTSWYLDLASNFTSGRTVIVASNVEVDYSFCHSRLDILDYK